ncbi:MAG: hypothetical protein ACI8TX_000063 [Hyphomicrobiaceae bacterium]
MGGQTAHAASPRRFLRAELAAHQVFMNAIDPTSSIFLTFSRGLFSTAVAVLALLIGLGAGIASANDWICRSPSLGGVPVCGDLVDAASHGGHVVVVGDAGVILASDTPGEADAWRERRSGVRENLHGIVHGASRWVAVGAAGSIVQSVDAVGWQTVESGVVDDLWSVTHGAGLFVAVGGDIGRPGLVLTSPNGVDWTERFAPAEDELRRVIFDGSRFVAVGGAGARVFSTDGISWQAGRRNFFFTHLRGVASNGTTIVAVGQGNPLDDPFILSSPDGERWTVRERGDVTLGDVVWTGAEFIAQGRGGQVWGSDDGLAWQQLRGDPSADVKAIDVLPDASVLAVGTRFAQIALSTGGVVRLVVGRPFEPGVGWKAVASTPIGLVAVGGDTLAGHSQNGVVWTGGPVGAQATRLEAVVGGGAGLHSVIAAGGDGRIYLSHDAISWETVTTPTASDLKAMVVGDGRAVAVGNAGALISSTNGRNWTAHASSATSDLAGVAFAAGRFCAVGSDGATATSTDGTTWVAGLVGLPVELAAVAWNGTDFLAADDFGRAWLSNDCSQWARVTTATVLPMFAAAASPQSAVLAGLDGVITSKSGSAPWVSEFSGTRASLDALAASGPVFVAVGEGGVILTGQDNACGDLGGDGSLQASDALSVLRKAVAGAACPLRLCDADGDGRVLASDALAVLRGAVGLVANLRC